MKQYINKENLKVLGNASYRVGKEIVREGTKVVVVKAASTALGATISKGLDGVKQLDLNDVLGDITRIENREKKKFKRFKKREMKRIRKRSLEEGKDLNDSDIEKIFKENFTDIVEKDESTGE